MPFTLTETHLRTLFEAASFELPGPGEMVFVGLRGCTPVGAGGTSFAAGQELEYLDVDYRHLRCTVAQWEPGQGLAVFPASTVPYLDVVQAHLSQGGKGVNQLALGYFRDKNSYYKGFHKHGSPNSRHRAFRNDSALPVWRTGDDVDFDTDDRLEYGVVYDNIHCAWQQNAAADYYSSNGCQVIVGRPQVEARGWTTELGPWGVFVANAYGRPQHRFSYALFSGREALAAATGGQLRATVRFGSSGELVHVVQDALIKHGYDVGVAGADGDCGFATVSAVRRFQAKAFGPAAADLIVGPATAEALGIDWPRLGAPPPPLLDARRVEGTEGPIRPILATANAADDTKDAPHFRSLTPNGFYSSNPFDLSVKRSIRTNNPGALNISPWQKAFPGYAGVTQPDRASNITTIYVTPEHGVAAWHHLMTDRYGYGEDGAVVLKELARKYAGVPNADHPAARTYVAGWRRASGDKLAPDTSLRFASDDDMLLLARAMFAHECGGDSPLKDEQILTALELKRADRLPPD